LENPVSAHSLQTPLPRGKAKSVPSSEPDGSPLALGISPELPDSAYADLAVVLLQAADRLRSEQS
jgi:hypothetical protein